MYKRFLLKNLHMNDLNVKVCGIRSFKPGEELVPKSNQQHVLHYVTQGTGKMVQNEQTYPVSVGDMFIASPGKTSRYQADLNTPFTYIWVSLDCSAPVAALLEYPTMHVPWAMSIFSRMVSCGNSSAPEWTVCALMYEFIAQLAEQRSEATTPAEDYVNKTLNYIQTNYMEPIAIADLAADLGLSRHYFCRMFKQQTSVSPQQYLVSYRLEMAARLLAEEGISQKEAATRVGYPDVYSFSRMFKRVYGMPPGEYIRQRQPDE